MFGSARLGIAIVLPRLTELNRIFSSTLDGNTGSSLLVVRLANCIPRRAARRDVVAEDVMAIVGVGHREQVEDRPGLLRAPVAVEAKRPWRRS